MGRYSIGFSRFGALNGVEQFLTDATAAAQFNSLAHDFDATRSDGVRLVANEGLRSRERQRMLRTAYETYLRDGHPFANLAAPLFFSYHDEETRGVAADVGTIDKHGVYRQPTAAEFAWIHARAAMRGFIWTGADFRPVEVWHIEGGHPAKLAPIPGVRVAGSPIPAPTPAPEEDDVATQIIGANGRGQFLDNNGEYYSINGSAEAKQLLASGVKVLKVGPLMYDKMARKVIR